MILKIRKNYFIFGLVFLAAFFIFGSQVNLVKAQATHGRDINTFAKPPEGTLFSTEWNNLLGYNGTAVFASGLPLGSFVPTFLPAMMDGPLGIGMEPAVGGARLNVRAFGTNNILSLQNSASTAVMTVLNNGNVGIGEANPANKLTIAALDHKDLGPIISMAGTSANQVESGRIRFTGMDISQPPRYQGAFIHYNASSNTLNIGVHNNADDLTSNDVNAISIARSNANVFLVPTTGNVGVGTTALSHKLSVSGSATSYSIDSGDKRIGNVADPVIAKDVVTLGYLSSSLSALAPGGASSTWAINGTHIYNINSDNVGVGTGAVALGSKLVVKGTGTTNATSALNVTNSANTSILFVRDDGNIGIGTTTVGAKLTLADHTTNVGGIRFRTAATAVDLWSRDSAILTTAANFEATSFRAGNGTAALPSLSFSGDTDTGIYSGGTNILAFSTAATERMRILANGNVGIGSTTPAHKLSIAGSPTSWSIDAGNQRIGNAADPVIDKDVVTLGYLSSSLSALAPGGASSTWAINGTHIYNINSDNVGVGTGAVALGSKLVVKGTGTTNATSALNVTNSANTSILFVRDDGNIGIGTSTPGAGLHVNRTDGLFTLGSVTFGGPLYIDRGASSILTVDNSGNVYATSTSAITTAVGLPTTATNGQTLRYNNGSWVNNSVLFNDGTNVGIGTTAPGAKLVVNNNVSAVPGSLPSGTSLHFIQADATAGRFIMDAFGSINVITMRRANGTAASPTAVLNGDSMGNIGAFGYGSTGYAYSNRVNIGFVSEGNWTDSSYPSAITFATTPNNSVASTERMRITNSGNVGIGSTTPAHRLSIAGSPTSWSIDAGNQRIGNAADPVIAKDVVTLGYLSSSLSALAPGGASSTWALSGNNIYNSNIGNVGIGTSTPGLDKLRVVGPVGIFGSLNLNNNNITGVNKLTVNTIDPLYNIGGTNYSTFAAAIVGGVKEEYIGRLEVKTKRAFGDYETVIDFNKQKEGSDLWVWHKTVDFSEENVEVFLSPYGDFARTYFLIEGEKLIIRADRPVTVHYRLIGRRLDWREWPTKALDQEEKAGFFIN